MWTAEVISKQVTDGLLGVEVRFTDGKTILTDRYETRSGQDIDWLKSNIQRRLSDLETVHQFADTISVGTFDIKAKPKTIVLEGNAEYKTKLNEFGKYVEAIKKGVVSEDNPDFIACHKWLKDNFSKDVISLF